MTSLPQHIKYLIIGAGIHGLSTAYHLALKLRSRKIGSGADILVIDKDDLGAGASGIACGVIRNNYYQPAMRELMAHSVSVWESDPKSYAYNPVGYLQISHEDMHEDICGIYSEQRSIGYESELIEGKNDSDCFMKNLFSDWQAESITSVLHEKKGGYAHNLLSLRGLRDKAVSEGVTLLSNCEVKEFKFYGGSSSAIESVITNKGMIACDYVIAGVGPWIRDIWNMLDLPKKIDIGSSGELHKDVQMWTYWQLEEGVLEIDPNFFRLNNGCMPPVIHIDSDAPLISDLDGSVITENHWGIYYKPDIHFDGIQGGAMPYKITTNTNDVAIDPYGPSSPEFTSSKNFSKMWCSALAHCHKRFEGMSKRYNKSPSGGLGCFTPDCFPIFDVFKENCYVIADSNHGYKMIGVGELVAEEILGNKSELMVPFKYDRFKKGNLHPTSNSPFPWS